jgi:hypothetical protein
MILKVQGEGVTSGDGRLTGRVLRWYKPSPGKRQVVHSHVYVCGLSLPIKLPGFKHAGSTLRTLS